MKAIERVIALNTASEQIMNVCSLCCKKDTRLGTGLIGKEVLAKIILYVYTVFIPDLFGT
ncbi:hypothetical protein [Endozoicomonas elysicola]|uniref:Uncharacterized protein n=1 Tax=Endozoicomonas elysicola TaxID=305900 RepID=A0A081KBP6_9GAMM|nr:hypothetical protein [Endozoicomonas elysicola]KEI71572.1 hypothetical protein GV64_13230 [Endozoicomonas elysicola]